MKKIVRILTCLAFVVGIISCTSQSKKADEAKSEPVMPKNFERAVPPTMLTEPQERADYLVMHYWDKFDFKDTMYCHAPDITEQALVDFFALFPYASYDKVCDGVKKLLKSAEADSVMYQYFCDKADHYLFNPNSQMRNDEYYIPFLVQMVSSSSRLDDAHKIRPQKQLELAYRNRLNEKASDFVYTLASGKTGTLYGISSKYILLMFYNPGCPECQHTMEMLSGSTFVNDAIKAGRLKVLAVYPDEDLTEWKNHAKEVPSTWINSYDKSLDLKNKEIYDLKAIPTLYLLDKDKKVILKDTSAGDIHEYLEKNK